MAVLQSTQSELRYMKRGNLEQESRIVGNYYRDLIRSYGVDCNYYVHNTDQYSNFKLTIDQNTILKQAYGYDISPDYSLSAKMLTFLEVQQDIFQLNKFGLNPDMDVDFYFDSVDFACALAPKLGQFKEYKLDERTVTCEVPYLDDRCELIDGHEVYLSSYQFPYELGLGYAAQYSCEMLSGLFRAVIPGYEFDKEQTIVCQPYEHTDFFVKFPVNKDLYKSFKRKIENDEFLETLIYLTYKVTKVKTGPNDEDFKCILTGKIHGSVLFFDINSIGKYVDQIHPNVGDIITIDFPDENNREQYEITDCFDKQLTQDGISPLLHKYVWKCKAKRYINSYEDMENNEANDRLQEKIDYQSRVTEEVAKSVSFYPENEDAAYGGYELQTESVADYDKQDVRNVGPQKIDFLDYGTAIDIMRFDVGSRLVTNGYELIFCTANTDAYVIAADEHARPPSNATCFESGLKWLKASKSQLVFVNIEGDSNILATTDYQNNPQKELNLNSLYNQTFETDDINENYQNAVKFKGCRTYMFANADHLFVKFENSDEPYQLC